MKDELREKLNDFVSSKMSQDDYYKFCDLMEEYTQKVIKEIKKIM